MSTAVIAADEPIYKIGGDVSSPALLHKLEPKYTKAARAAKIQGRVVLEIVVGKNGRAREIKVLKSLSPDLDANAVKAVSKWRFKPALKRGRAVPVRAHVEVNFRLL